MPDAGRTPPAMLWRLSIFVAVFMLAQSGWEALRGTAVESWVIHTATVTPAAKLVNLLTPAVRAEAVGAVLRAPGGGINILNGCEGTEAVFLLVAALAVAPLRPRKKLLGMLAGTCLVLAANQLRIIGLFYAFRTSKPLFGFLHSTLLPIAMMVVVLVFFVGWVRAHERIASA